LKIKNRVKRKTGAFRCSAIGGSNLDIRLFRVGLE
jgi:hypothetical protein